MGYVVLVDILDEIDTAAGFRPDGTPNRIVEHHEGDIVDLNDLDPARLQVLKDLNCIEDESAAKERESSQESDAGTEEGTPRKAQGANKSAS